MWLLETKSNWYHDIAGHQTKVNTSMEKYTAKQYAEMAGGHTVSEEKKSLNLGFIGSELTESRMFRSKGRVEGTSNRDMADLAFMNLIALYIFTMSMILLLLPKAMQKRPCKVETLTILELVALIYTWR